MTTQNKTELAEQIKSAVFEWLKTTPYAATSLVPLLGGNANFVYRAYLAASLPDDRSEVLVKHGQPYMANFPENGVAIQRCGVEKACLEALGALRFEPERLLGVAAGCEVRTPKLYHYDEATHTQIIEFFPNSTNLKSYAVEKHPSPTPSSLRPRFHALGGSIARYITAFHGRATTPDDSDLYAEVKKSSREMQTLKHRINYDWLIERVDMFPAALTGEDRAVFLKVGEMAQRELEQSQHGLKCIIIHGDFCAQNVILPNIAMGTSAPTSIFVVDWENAQLGVPAMDHGEMLGELYALHLYKRSTAGLWMAQGYAEGLGKVSEDEAYRIALQMGVHLLSFSSVTPGMGSKEQILDLVRVARDIVVNAWQRKREWFEDGDLGCLFRKSGL